MIKKLHVKVAILEISNQLMKEYDFTNCLTQKTKTSKDKVNLSGEPRARQTKYGTKA